MFLTLPNTCTDRGVWERVDRGGAYGSEIPVGYHLWPKKGVNWLKNRLEAIDKNPNKDKTLP